MEYKVEITIQLSHSSILYPQCDDPDITNDSTQTLVSSLRKVSISSLSITVSGSNCFVFALALWHLSYRSQKSGSDVKSVSISCFSGNPHHCDGNCLRFYTRSMADCRDPLQGCFHIVSTSGTIQEVYHQPVIPSGNYLHA
ncbi:uncharacterized protein BDZ99DRAFT_166154 [Mytilinidion resinicola]|uniref:Uncharacterized protein n=1 Tax=Mytilinidion resinicola TaxID=574789 RepID=A0A6A6Y4S0_9PEZI|nr:uncharacterized protein BDZ99DRAFT_166154 [Mytilinidion resinicola]KAF2803518.1 hypothetical protein BDZ99DRAFT_166154 [Mytilinidion resinicola]